MQHQTTYQEIDYDEKHAQDNLSKSSKLKKLKQTKKIKIYNISVAVFILLIFAIALIKVFKVEEKQSYSESSSLIQVSQQKLFHQPLQQKQQKKQQFQSQKQQQIYSDSQQIVQAMYLQSLNHQIKWLQKPKINLSEQDSLKSVPSRYLNVSPRIKILQMTIQQKIKSTNYQALIINHIFNHNTTNNIQSQDEVLINSLANIITYVSQIGIQKILILIHPEYQMNKIIQYISYLEQIQHHKVYQERVSANYSFILKAVSSYKWVYFCHANLILEDLILIKTIQEVKASQDKLLFYSKKQSADNDDLTNKDLSKLQLPQLNYYFFALRVELFDLISPVNFSYNTLFHIYELMIIPSLAFCQGIQKSIVKLSTQFKYKQIYRDDDIQFELNNILRKQESYKAICFIATPTNSSQNRQTELKQYLESFQSYALQQMQKQTYLIISFVYSGKKSIFNIFKTIWRFYQDYKENKQFSLRIRLRHQAVQNALQLYEISHNYIPFVPNIPVFHSRMNIKLYPKTILLDSIMQYFCQKHEYPKYVLFPKYKKDGEVKVLPSLAIMQKRQRSEYNMYYEQYMKHGQFVCSGPLRSLPIIFYKWLQTQFYETQYAFIMTLAQNAKDTYNISQNILFQVLVDRQYSEKEKQQMEGLLIRNQGRRKYKKSKIPNGIKYNQLNNKAYKRNPPDIIPKIIHQIWLTKDNSNFSQVRFAMAQTIVQKNPTFDYWLWTFDDFTQQNFPISYEYLKKLLQATEDSKKNLLAMVTDAMRIEILYHHGGIYIDFKAQSLKSLLPFLKFQQFFFSLNVQGQFDRNDPRNETVLVNGIIGSIPRHRNFYRLIAEHYRPQNVKKFAGDRNSDLQVGLSVGKYYTAKQIRTQLMDFGFFCGGSFDRPCLNLKNQLIFTEQQKVFTVQTYTGIKYKIGIPCLADKQKYIELYRHLGRTYRRKKQKFD